MLVGVGVGMGGCNMLLGWALCVGAAATILSPVSVVLVLY
jgi:hypothetical protein